MNREKSSYTIIYASIMVVLVAVGLAFTHQVLNKKQITNANIDKMQQVLRSLRVDASTGEAEAKYDELIKEAYLIDKQGNKIEGSEGIDPKSKAFATDLTLELKKPEADRRLPVFIAEVDGQRKVVIPMSGKGLWGPIWGYMAIDNNGSTVYGTDFGHASETPGLGAEIVTPAFRNQFRDKDLIKEGTFKSIAVVKLGKSVSDRDYVDGISGGTLTSKGVHEMLWNSVGDYKNFLMQMYQQK